MLQRREVDFHGGKRYLDLIEEEFWIGSPKARERTPESCGVEKEGKLPSGSYSTVKSARRESATLSIRSRGRVQIIDM